MPQQVGPSLLGTHLGHSESHNAFRVVDCLENKLGATHGVDMHGLFVIIHTLSQNVLSEYECNKILKEREGYHD